MYSPSTTRWASADRSPFPPSMQSWLLRVACSFPRYLFLLLRHSPPSPSSNMGRFLRVCNHNKIHVFAYISHFLIQFIAILLCISHLHTFRVSREVSCSPHFSLLTSLCSLLSSHNTDTICLCFSAAHPFAISLSPRQCIDPPPHCCSVGSSSALLRFLCLHHFPANSIIVCIIFYHKRMRHAIHNRASRHVMCSRAQAKANSAGSSRI